MSKRFFEGAKHSLQYSLHRPKPPLSLIEEIVGKVEEKVNNLCAFNSRGGVILWYIVWTRDLALGMKWPRFNFTPHNKSRRYYNKMETT